MTLLHQQLDVFAPHSKPESQRGQSTVSPPGTGWDGMAEEEDTRATMLRGRPDEAPA
jgi:hypothetical protein